MNGRYSTYWNVPLGAEYSEEAAEAAAARIQQSATDLMEWMRQIKQAINLLKDKTTSVNNQLTRDLASRVEVAEPATVRELVYEINYTKSVLADPRAPSVSGLVLPQTALAKVEEENAEEAIKEAETTLLVATGGAPITQTAGTFLSNLLSWMKAPDVTNSDVRSWWADVSVPTGFLNTALDNERWQDARVAWSNLTPMLTKYAQRAAWVKPTNVSQSQWDKFVEIVQLGQAAAERAKREIPRTSVLAVPFLLADRVRLGTPTTSTETTATETIAAATSSVLPLILIGGALGFGVYLIMRKRA